jgi:hypothetical protein
MTIKLPFMTTSMVREFDGTDGYVYRAITTLDFHEGWYTVLRRTKRLANGYPQWSHGSITQALVVTGEWSSQSGARPLWKFATFEAAEAWLIEHFNPGAAEIEAKARAAYIKDCDESGINPNRLPNWEELPEERREEWRGKVQ